MEDHAPVPPASLALLDAGRHPVAARLAWNLRHRCAVGPRTKVVVALSGGADSTAACALMAALASRDDAPALVGALHVHHHLRESADADASCANRTATALGVPFVRCDVTVSPDGNVMALAREARYAALADAARSLGAVAVLTAHHADDQLETLLLQALRGDRPWHPATSWRRPIGGGVDAVRPLLDVSRSELRECAFALALEWSEDPTNGDPGRQRARLRLDVLPALQAMFPQGPAHGAAFVHLVQDWASLAREHMQRMVGAGPLWDRRLLARTSPDLLAWWLGHCAGSTVPASTMHSIVRAIRDDTESPRQWNGWRLDGRTLSYSQPE